jgi:hypothetical protein
VLAPAGTLVNCTAIKVVEIDNIVALDTSLPLELIMNTLVLLTFPLKFYPAIAREKLGDVAMKGY